MMKAINKKHGINSHRGVSTTIMSKEKKETKVLASYNALIDCQSKVVPLISTLARGEAAAAVPVQILEAKQPHPKTLGSRTHGESRIIPTMR